MTAKGVAFGGNVVPIMAKSARASDNAFVYRESDVVNSLAFVSNLVGSGTSQQRAIAAVNMSFIMGTAASDFFSSSCDSSYPALRDAVEVLHHQGVVVVAGSGNFGRDASYAGRIGAPACLSKVVAVGATQRNDDQVADYSNIGVALDLLAPGGTDEGTALGTCGTVIDFDFTFPNAVLSAVPQNYPCRYYQQHGTSMSSPHVAGAAAVMRQRYPGSTPSAIVQHLRNTGTQLSFSHQGSSYQKPRLNLAAAMAAPPAPSGSPSSLAVQSQQCFGEFFLAWPGVAGSVTEYQVESANSSGFSGAKRVFFGPAQANYPVSVSTTTYFRVRACNTVSCGPWRNGNAPATPVG